MVALDRDLQTRSLRLISDGPDTTRAIAAALAPILVIGDLVALTGDLAAGKTCFTQGLGTALGVDEPITSPTFTLANRHRGRLVLHHLDVYRLAGEADAIDLDLDELLETGVVVVEWAERIAGLLPADHLLVRLHHPEPGSSDDPGSAFGADLDRRIIEIEGPVEERGLDRVLEPWVVAGPEVGS